MPMANPEHVAILKRGVEVWNKWRIANPEVRPDLSEADLNKADLSEANLWFAFGGGWGLVLTVELSLSSLPPTFLWLTHPKLR